MSTSSSDNTPAALFESDLTELHRALAQSDPDVTFFSREEFRELCAEGDYIHCETAEDDVLNGRYFVWDSERFFQVWENRHADFVQLTPMPADWDPDRATEWAEAQHSDDEYEPEVF